MLAKIRQWWRDGAPLRPSVALEHYNKFAYRDGVAGDMLTTTEGLYVRINTGSAQRQNQSQPQSPLWLHPTPTAGTTVDAAATLESCEQLSPVAPPAPRSPNPRRQGRRSAKPASAPATQSRPKQRGARRVAPTSGTIREGQGNQAMQTGRPYPPAPPPSRTKPQHDLDAVQRMRQSLAGNPPAAAPVRKKK